MYALIAILVIIILVIYYSTKKEGAYVDVLRPTSIMPSMHSNQLYRFYRGMTFPGQNVFVRKDLAGNIPALMALCDSMPNCVGFSSTSGELKRHILPPDNFKPIMAARCDEYGCGPADGLYVKSNSPCY